MLLSQVFTVRSISCGDILTTFLMLMTGRALKEQQLNEVMTEISGVGIYR